MEALQLQPLPSLPSVCSIVDRDGRDSGFGAILKPLYARSDIDALASFARGRRMLGFTQFGTFPRVHSAFDDVLLDGRGRTIDGRDRSYLRACDGWAHCFRDPGSHLPRGRPRVLLSRSDFTDPDRVSAVAGGAADQPKRWDMLYVCDPHRFAEVTKNWELAKRCLARLASELQITALLVGRAGCHDVPDSPGIDVTGQLTWPELLRSIARSRLAFFPNELDASPRVLAEALALDVPVLVNRRILGGWKYVSTATGAFFDGESDVVAAARACLSRTHTPRAWFSQHHGPEHAGRVLARFVHLL